MTLWPSQQTDSQNHLGQQEPLEGMSFNPPLKHGQLEQVVRDHGHSGLQYLQGWRLHHLFHSCTSLTLKQPGRLCPWNSMCFRLCPRPLVPPLIARLWAQPFSHFAVHLTAHLRNPYFLSLSTSVQWETATKASFKYGSTTTATALPSSNIQSLQHGRRGGRSSTISPW